MVVRKAYPRTPYERVGQYNHRAPHIRPSRDELPFIAASDGPDSVIFVTKRKGFGSLGNKESFPMSKNSVSRLLTAFPKEKYYRYKVNIYLKRCK